MHTISLKSLRGKKLYEHGRYVGVCAGLGFNFLIGKVTQVFVSSWIWLPWTYCYEGYVQRSPKGMLEVHKEHIAQDEYNGSIIHVRVFTEGGKYLGKVEDIFLSEDLQYMLQLYVQRYITGKTYLIHRTQIVSMKKGEIIVRDNTVEVGNKEMLLSPSVVSSVPMMKKL